MPFCRFCSRSVSVTCNSSSTGMRKCSRDLLLVVHCVRTTSTTHVAKRLGKYAVGPSACKTRLIRNGIPPAPIDAATEKSAESTDVRSWYSFTIPIVIAWDGPVPRAKPATASSTVQAFLGQNKAGRQQAAEARPPEITIFAGRGLQRRQMKGAKISRLAMKRIQNTRLMATAVEYRKPVFVATVMSQVPQETSTPIANMARNEHHKVNWSGICDPDSLFAAAGRGFSSS
mmetsp:Transcript_48798/g.113960  ORF Transcript_48798/g.113960 Transcript_48798/m.113960 type:complete len:230 (-) Transcript_48798:679-1368(-)